MAKVEVFYRAADPFSTLLTDARWAKVLDKEVEDPAPQWALEFDPAGVLWSHDRDLRIAEEVWYRMNRIDREHEWPELDELRLRGMSVGDVVVVDGRPYQAVALGFEPLDVAEFESRIA